MMPYFVIVVGAILAVWAVIGFKAAVIVMMGALALVALTYIIMEGPG